MAALGIDPALRQAVEDAEVAASVAEIRRNVREGRTDMTGALLSQLGAAGTGLRGETQTEMTTTAVEFTLYNRDDGVPSKVSYDQLEKRLLIRFDTSHPTMAGELVWSATPIQGKTMVGAMFPFKCPLDPASPDRAYWNEHGLGHVVCRKTHGLRTEIDLERHIKIRHPSLHERIQRKREDDIRNAQNALMQRQTEAMEAMALAYRQGGTGLVVPNLDPPSLEVRPAEGSPSPARTRQPR